MAETQQQQQFHLELHFTDSYQPLTDTVEKSVTLELLPEQIRSGIITQLSVTGKGSRNFTVLLAIASFMNADQKSFPSQQTLADVTGFSLPTVRAAIEELTEIKIAGQAVLEKVKVPSATGKHLKTVYKLAAVSAEESEQLDAAGQQPMNSKDVLLLFCELYQQEFGIEYVPAWGREMAMIKQKLIGKFSDEDLKEIVKIAVTQYKQYWANQQFPLPTVGQLTSWLANKAMAILTVEREQQQQTLDRIAVAEKVEQYDSAALLDL